MLALNKRLIGIGVTIIALLLIPFTATQLSDEVNWDATDFLIMGSILVFIATAYELIARKSEKIKYRAGFGIGLLGAFLLIWVNGAVGIIGNEGQDVNLLFVAVLLVGLVGSLLVKFKARGMAKTLFAVAAIQMAVPIAGLIIWPPPDTSWSPGVFGVFLMCGFFAMLFLVSGLLFQQADKED